MKDFSCVSSMSKTRVGVQNRISKKALKRKIKSFTKRPVASEPGSKKALRETAAEKKIATAEKRQRKKAAKEAKKDEKVERKEAEEEAELEKTAALDKRLRMEAVAKAAAARAAAGMP